MRLSPTDYPEGHPIRKQLEAASSGVPAQVSAPPPSRAGRAKQRRVEQQIQIECVKWADSTVLAMVPGFSRAIRDGHYAEVRTSKVGQFLFHIPNGGGRSKTEAGILIGMGVRAGVFDLCLSLPLVHPTASGLLLRAGLYVEMKDPEKGVLSDEQTAFGVRMRSVLYEAETATSVDEFISAVWGYAAIYEEAVCKRD